MKKILLLSLLFFCITSCSNSIGEFINNEDGFSVNSEEVFIADELIYGEEYSLFEICNSQNRSARFIDDELVEMVYFSVLPTTVESVYSINEKLGFLNPVQLNKEIIQACDPETIIFKDEKDGYEGEIELDKLFNFDIRYYYILPSDKVNLLYDDLENIEIIEKFYMPSEDVIAEYENQNNKNTSRGLFNSNKIYGNIKYNMNGTIIPAYGVTMRRGIEYTCSTDKNGCFSLGSKANIGGLCYIWVDYKNDACSVSNICGITCATLLKTAFPSKLTNITIIADSGYCTGKLAICNEIKTRSEKERYKMPLVKVWTTELGEGTSSAPCFNLNRGDKTLDIFLTNCDSYSVLSLRVLHHEYSHYYHNWMVGNKMNFWESIISSEINSSTKYAGTQFVNKILGTKYNASFYDFSNPYVNFAENFAEWYSYIGGNKGAYVSVSKKNYNVNELTVSSYKNAQLFMKLVQAGIISENDLISLICNKKIITFQEFYTALINKLPNSKQQIVNIFRTNYQGYGNSISY